jgi:hypothetical protein
LNDVHVGCVVSKPENMQGFFGHVRLLKILIEEQKKLIEEKD